LSELKEIAMDIERIASDSGMQVVLDGRIGREEYKSVYDTDNFAREPGVSAPQ
jgi:hypothetical protein